MKHFLFALLTFFTAVNLYSQQPQVPVYPEPQEGFKRMDLILPKTDNDQDYQVEIKFSIEGEVYECSNASFSFNNKNLVLEYGLSSSRFPYYVIKDDVVEIIEALKPGCPTGERIKKKILSTQNILREYNSSYPIPFYIPKEWNVEYRLWRPNEVYSTVK